MSQQHFNKGDTVEVLTRNDENALAIISRGSYKLAGTPELSKNGHQFKSTTSCYYAATVLKSPSRKNNTVYVEYHTVLVSDGNGSSRPVREHIDGSRVRPPPPADIDLRFGLGEDVDAFCGNGWRVGSVFGILMNSNYLVVFGDGEEQVEFEGCDLRIHRDWKDGFWTPPLGEMRKPSQLETKPKQVKFRIKYSGRTSEAKFSKGKTVEVRSDEEGFEGSWYTAVVIDSVGNDKFLVQYETLTTDDETELLKTYADASHIRPCPPEIPQRGYFKRFQEVDAWYNDGWWVGHIFKVLDNYTYIVYFGGTKDEMTVQHSKLRPHQEWIDGKWIAASVRSSEFELKSKERELKVKKIKYCETISEAIFSNGTLVEVKSNEEGFQGSWYTALILSSMGKDKYLVEYQTLKTEDATELLKDTAHALYIRPCPPVIQRLDRFKLIEKVNVWYNDGWWMGLISRVLEGLTYAVYFWNSNEELLFHHFDLRPHQEWIGGKFVADFLKRSSELPLKPKPGKLKGHDGLTSLETNCITNYPKSKNYFTKGMKVEVRSAEEGYSNSWYPAIIIFSKGSGKYLVEYLTLKSDTENELLKEAADALCIRPRPPVIQRSDPFEPFEDVEAWYKNAWWVGSVSKVIQNKGSEYAVYIRGTNEILEFQHSDLRPNCNWVDGKWVTPCRGRTP